MKKQTILILSILFMLMIPMDASAATITASAATTYTLSGNAKVIITFDDGLKSTIDNAMPVLKGNGQKAVAFVYEEAIVGSDGTYYTDYMSTADLTTLKNEGWDISAHSYTHCCEPIDDNDVTSQNYLVNANNSVLYHELVEVKNWLESLNFVKSAMFFAYPYGAHDEPLPTNLATTGYLGARTVEAYTELNPNYVGYTLPNYLMETLEVETAAYPPAEVIRQINLAVNNSGTLILTFHGVRTPPLTQYEYSIEDFTNISNYLKELNSTGNVQVMTMSEYFNVPATITPNVPPTPINPMTNVSSRRSVVFSWTEGEGVETSNYDIVLNGVPYKYFELNKTITIPAQPEQIMNISVYAVNNTWGIRNLSVLPLNMSATITGYTPSTPIGMASTFGSNWIKTNWTANNTGNKTDMYNVVTEVQSVTTWYNETTNTSVNVTGLTAGQTVSVKVYALNGTIGATTKNPIPAEKITSLPTTNLPVIESRDIDSVNFKMNWTVRAGNSTDSVDITTTINGGTTTTLTVSLVTNTTTEHVLSSIPAHAVVTFGVLGRNGTTGLPSLSIYGNQTMPNNLVILSNVNEEYNTPPGSIFKLYPLAYDRDIDVVTFIKGDSSDITSINTTTGEFTFDTTNVSLGKYNFSITANDNHGSNQTAIFKVNVINNPPPERNSGSSSGGSSSGGGAAMGSSESFNNIVKYDSKDLYLQSGKDSIVNLALNPGIYQLILNGQTQDLTVKVENLKGNQSGLPEVQGNALLYTNLMISSTRMNGVSFSFKLNKSAVTNPANVKVFVWSNDAWTPVEVSQLTNTDLNNVYFSVKATPSKLSKFAITEISGNDINLDSGSSIGTNTDTNLADATKVNAISNGNDEPKGSPGFEVVLSIVAVMSVLYLRRKL